jgi:hypothetical protein
MARPYRNRLAAVLVAFAICVAAAAALRAVTRAHVRPSDEDVRTPSGAPPGSRLDAFLALEVLKLEDIQANEAGRISPREAERLRAYLDWQWRMYLDVGVGILVVGALVAGAVGHARTGRRWMLLAPVGVALALAPIYLWGNAHLSAPSREAAAGKVVAVEGALEAAVSDVARDASIIRIGGGRYDAYGLAALVRTLAVGDRVRAFALPETRTVVALSPP